MVSQSFPGRSRPVARVTVGAVDQRAVPLVGSIMHGLVNVDSDVAALVVVGGPVAESARRAACA